MIVSLKNEREFLSAEYATAYWVEQQQLGCLLNELCLTLLLEAIMSSAMQIAILF
jgi:hypothetical protein